MHFNGRLKPWLWRLYPLHGWFRYWNQFTDSLQNLYWEHQPSLYLWIVPVLSTLIVWCFTQTQAFTRLMYNLSGRYQAHLLSPWLFRYSDWVVVPYPLVAATVAPVVVCLSESLLPPILPIVEGWILFFVWTLFMFWILYIPLCLYGYLHGFALGTFGSSEKEDSKPEVSYSI